MWIHKCPLALALDWQDNHRERQDQAVVNQCSKPTGWLGRFTFWRMNSSHSKLTDWALQHVSMANHDTIPDVGCGGGRTVKKLAAITTKGKVYGRRRFRRRRRFSKRTNARWRPAASKYGKPRFLSCHSQTTPSTSSLPQQHTTSCHCNHSPPG